MASPIVTTGNFARRLWPGLNHFYGLEYERRLNEYQDIFETRVSDKRFEMALSMKGMDIASVKQEAAAIDYDSFKQVFTAKYVNIVYGKGFMISHEMLEDDQYPDNLIAMGTAELNTKMKLTKEIVGANILNNGWSSAAANLGPDGVSLFSASHPRGDGGTYSNKPSVDADFSEASAEQAFVDISSFVDDTGYIISLKPKHIIFHRNDIFNAERVLKNPMRPATADRDINASYQLGSFPGGPRLNHYVTDADAWYVIVDCPSSLIHYTREGYNLATDDDFDTDNTKVKVTERYCFGWSNPRGIYASQGA